MSRSWVLDASALLALLNEEPGSQQVEEAIEEGAVMGAVNLSEVAAKLNEIGVPDGTVHEILDNLGIEIIDLDQSQAYIAGFLRVKTKHAGLSLGDRACLAVAKKLELPCLTADKAWTGIRLPIKIKSIR